MMSLDVRFWECFVEVQSNRIANSHNFDRNDTWRAAGIVSQQSILYEKENDMYLGRLYNNGGNNEKRV